MMLTTSWQTVDYVDLYASGYFAMRLSLQARYTTQNPTAKTTAVETRIYAEMFNAGDYWFYSWKYTCSYATTIEETSSTEVHINSDRTLISGGTTAQHDSLGTWSAAISGSVWLSNGVDETLSGSIEAPAFSTDPEPVRPVRYVNKGTLPTLYESTETAFTTNGIGRMADAISCVVTEQRNGVYELEMVYPASGKYANELKTDRIILAQPADIGDTQPFRIKKVSKPLNGKIQIYAQHISYDLNGIPVAPFTTVGTVNALSGLVRNALLPVGYSVWTDIPNVETAYTNSQVQSFRACLGGTQGSILDTYRQVEYEFDRFIVKAHQYRGTDRNVSIRYGKNLTELMHETSTEAVYTGVIAQWIDSQSGTCVSGNVQYTVNHDTAPVEKIFILDATSDFEEQPSVDELSNRAMQYISDNNLDVPSVNIKISFIPLWQTEEYKDIAALERVGMGDTVHIYFTDYEIAATAKVVRTVYDVLKGRYITIELGEAKSSLAKTIKQATNSELSAAIDNFTSSIRVVNNNIIASQQEMETRLAQALEEAGNLITGGTGGYVYISRNADGQPNEIYLMDTPDTGTAVNVIRMNMEGIAGSTSGVNGPWNFAMLIDGTIIADAITTGELNGALIRAGSILTSALEVDAQDAVAGVNQYFQFLADGLHIGQDGAEYSSVFSNLGMRVVNSNNTATLVAEEDTVTANNLTANTYLRITGSLATARFQTYHDNVDNEDMFGCYWEESN